MRPAGQPALGRRGRGALRGLPAGSRNEVAGWDIGGGWVGGGDGEGKRRERRMSGPHINKTAEGGKTHGFGR
jgi:hypothetical protein